MQFDVVTIFPEFFRGPFEFGVVAQAAKAGLLALAVHDLRRWTHDVHKTVDDRPFGGGEGMLLKCEPLFSAVEEILPDRTPRTKVVLCRLRADLTTSRLRENGVVRESTGCCSSADATKA